MVTTAIHRLVEHQAASRADALAIIDHERALTYRELNHRANGCARMLMARGFRRGAHAIVRMEPGASLAVVLLAILKAGGSYTWIDLRREPAAAPRGISFAADGPSSADHYVPVDMCVNVGDATSPSPNLPVLTRGTDIACVLRGRAGQPELLVPHATLAALHEGGQENAARMAGDARFVAETWYGDVGALDLWLMLMAGATVRIAVEEPAVAAA